MSDPEHTELLSHAIAAIANGECLELGNHMLWEPTSEVRAAVVTDEKRMTTWLPKRRLMCKMALLPNLRTVFDIDERYFYAQPDFCLDPSCPQGVVFYATYTEDAEPNEHGVSQHQPRLLVYDIEVPIETEMKESLCRLLTRCFKPMTPAQRYESLRREYARFLPVHNSQVMVQWVGYKESAYKVFSGCNIRHEIESLACLTDNPGRLVRPLRVIIPETTFQFVQPQHGQPHGQHRQHGQHAGGQGMAGDTRKRQRPHSSCDTECAGPVSEERERQLPTKLHKVS